MEKNFFIKILNDLVFRESIKSNPRGILVSNGFFLDDDVKIFVHENDEANFHFCITDQKYKLNDTPLYENSFLKKVFSRILKIQQMIWEDHNFKKKILKNSENIREFFDFLPQNTKIHIHENSNKNFHFILPLLQLKFNEDEKIENKEELSEAELDCISGGNNIYDGSSILGASNGLVMPVSGIGGQNRVGTITDSNLLQLQLCAASWGHIVSITTNLIKKDNEARKTLVQNS